MRRGVTLGNHWTERLEHLFLVVEDNKRLCKAYLDEYGALARLLGSLIIDFGGEVEVFDPNPQKTPCEQLEDLAKHAGSLIAKWEKIVGGEK